MKHDLNYRNVKNAAATIGNKNSFEDRLRDDEPEEPHLLFQEKYHGSNKMLQQKDSCNTESSLVMPQNALEWRHRELTRSYEKLERRYTETKAMLKSALKTLQSQQDKILNPLLEQA